MEEKMVPMSKDEFIAKYKAHQKEKERIRRYIMRRHKDERLFMLIKKKRRWS